MLDIDSIHYSFDSTRVHPCLFVSSWSETEGFWRIGYLVKINYLKKNLNCLFFTKEYNPNFKLFFLHILCSPTDC